MNSLVSTLRPRVVRLSRAVGEPFARATSAVRMLPDFVIVGAQRAGTTSLYKYLAEHPDVGQGSARQGRALLRHERRPVDVVVPVAFPARRQAIPLKARPTRVGEGCPYYMFHPIQPGAHQRRPSGRQDHRHPARSGRACPLAMGPRDGSRVRDAHLRAGDPARGRASRRPGRVARRSGRTELLASAPLLCRAWSVRRPGAAVVGRLRSRSRAADPVHRVVLRSRHDLRLHAVVPRPAAARGHLRGAQCPRLLQARTVGGANGWQNDSGSPTSDS